MDKGHTWMKAGAGLLVALGLGAGSGCSTTTSYTPAYEQQSKAIQGVTLDQAAGDAVAQRFVATFSQMGTPAFLPAAEGLFAQDGMYINDTLTLYTHAHQLSKHMLEMNNRVKTAHVQLIHAFVAGDSVYVHWRMEYTLHVLGVDRPMASFGISQLKVNAAGKIIFQQDYWDSNNGLYRQLPRIGWLYRWLLPMDGMQ